MQTPDERIEMVPRRFDAALVVSLAGEIDLGNAEAAAAALGRASAATDAGEVLVVDLTELSHLSLAAARALYRLAADRADQGLRTRLVAAPECIAARVARLSELDRYVLVCASLHDALDEPRQRTSR
jgi:anti-anti-sigma factor